MSGNQSPPHATQTFIAVAELIARGCYVVRSLHDWIRDHDRRPNLWGAPASRAHTLDCGGCHRNDWARDSDGREGNPSEGPPTVAQDWVHAHSKCIAPRVLVLIWDPKIKFTQ